EGSNSNQSGQLGATVKPGSAPNQDTEVKPNPDQNNNPTTGQDANQTGQGTQVKPNNDQTTTGTPAGTD
ncbi:signal peptide protein, partial [Staphylococcus epidermidis]